MTLNIKMIPRRYWRFANGKSLQKLERILNPPETGGG